MPAIEGRDGKILYTPITRDVFGYKNVIDGFASRERWFTATCDLEYPDAPTRVWEAFHERVVDPPDVMFTTRDGRYAGLASFEKFIHIESTHGSLNQINSATFLLTMTGRVKSATTLPTRDVMRTIEPGWRPAVVAK